MGMFMVIFIKTFHERKVYEGENVERIKIEIKIFHHKEQLWNNVFSLWDISLIRSLNIVIS